MTAEEIAEMNARMEQAKREYWLDISYDEAVNAEIRKQYSESQEFAILRQRDEKQEEYAEYFAYCESCKDFVKKKKTEYA
jgi:head-tail adaptor